jgi:histone H4
MTRRTPAGCGRAGKRHRWRTVLKDSMASALTQPATRRLARRAGVKRISGLIYEEAHKALRIWLGPVVQRAAMCAEHGQRFTITITDMLFALKASGM